jgi:hypothetical protein
VLDLQKKFRVPLRGQGSERLTVARHQGHDLVRRVSLHIAAPAKYEAEYTTSETHRWVAPDGP